MGTGGTPDGIGLQGLGTGAGAGVEGTGGANDGTGVQGNGSGFGAGVVGTGFTGVVGRGQAVGAGVLAENSEGGIALQVSGPSMFSRSGVVTIPAGQRTATVAPPGGLTATSLVLALMQNIAGSVLVKAAVPDVSGGTFQVVLNTAPGTGQQATVAWFVVN